MKHTDAGIAVELCAGRPLRTPSRIDRSACVLFAATLLCSMSLGYLLGARESVPEIVLASLVLPPAEGRLTEEEESGEPRLGAVAAEAHERHLPDPPLAEIGRLRAEILRLRVLFRRLADVAGLDGGEFELGLGPFELPEVRRAGKAAPGPDLSIRALDTLSRQSARMARIFDERRAAHDRRVGGRVAPGAVRTSGFGLRSDPFGGARRQLHRGVDYAGPAGSPIHALADGIVTWSGVNGGYGNLVEIEHGDGFRTRYAHNRGNLVALGERVSKGQVIAMLGSSGRSTGAHVHVEVREHGVALDPVRFIR